MKNPTTLRATMVALMAVAAVTTLAACTGPDNADEAKSTPKPTATEYTPAVTDKGAELVAKLGDCAQVAGHFGTLTEGLELSLESLGDDALFCDWVAADDENHVFSVEVLGAEPDAVPSPEAVAASGGTVVESAAVADAGGIAYAIAGADGTAYSLTAVLPEYSMSVSAVGGQIGEEQIGQIQAGVEQLLG